MTPINSRNLKSFNTCIINSKNKNTINSLWSKYVLIENICEVKTMDYKPILLMVIAVIIGMIIYNKYGASL